MFKFKRKRAKLNIKFLFFLININLEKYNKTIMTRKDFERFIEGVNGTPFADENSPLYVLRNKCILLDRLKENCPKLLKRDYISLKNATFKEFSSFVENNPKFIAKIIDGAYGKGIKIYDLNSKPVDLKSLYNELSDRNTFLLESHISNEKTLNNISPHSLSTVRIHTLRTGKKNENIEIVGIPFIRFGINEKEINNADSIIARIDVETGNIFGKILNSEYLTPIKSFLHPDTKISVENYKLPFWEEAKEAAIAAARLIPEVNFIGWDIALCDDGAVIIEGNGGPLTYNEEQGFLLAESKFRFKGIKEYYDLLCLYQKFSKTADENNINNLNKMIFENVCMQEKSKNYDYIIVLGSEKCWYRSEVAVKYSDENTVYIASGGNIHNQTFEYDTIAKVLVENGINKSKILFDKVSKNTYENIKNSFKIINKCSKNQSLPINIAVVTAGFHVKRTKLIIDKLIQDKKYNIEIISAFGKNTTPDNWYKTIKGFSIIYNELSSIYGKEKTEALFTSKSKF